MITLRWKTASKAAPFVDTKDAELPSSWLLMRWIPEGKNLAIHYSEDIKRLFAELQGNICKDLGSKIYSFVAELYEVAEEPRPWSKLLARSGPRCLRTMGADSRLLKTRASDPTSSALDCCVDWS